MYEIDFKSVLSSEMKDNGTLGCQTGDPITSSVDADNCELWGPIGYYARPSKAVPGSGSCQAVTVKAPDRDALIAFRDLRANEVYGNMGPGDIVIASSGANGDGHAKLAIRGDDAIVMSTADESGNGVYLRIDKTKLEFRAPWGILTFDKSGFHVEHDSGASMSLCGLGTIGAVTGRTNAAVIQAQSVTLDAPTVFLGPSQTSSPGTTGGAYLGALYGVIPPTAPGVPVLGVGIGAVTVAACASTKVFVGV